jgi:CheY-like chemotaxis protein
LDARVRNPYNHEETMNRSILLVDDENDIREVAQVTLEMTAGWEVHTAQDGIEGLRMARHHRPDAILLDVMMPGMDGPSTVRALRDDPTTAGIPVVLLTAKVRQSDRRGFDELHVAGVLSKPFDPLELAGQVSAALGW